MSQIKLGQTVRDVISGFTGIAIQALDQLNGNRRIAIQPKQKEGENDFPEAMFVDPHTLEILDDGFCDRTTPPTATSIALGAKVRDKASGFVGIALEKATYMNGCVSFGVIPPMRSDGMINSNPDKSWIAAERLEVVDAGLSVQPTVASTQTPARASGGPSTRVTNRY